MLTSVNLRKRGCADVSIGESDIVKAHLAQLGKVSCGKGCIRFKRLSDLNLHAVESILRKILELRKQGIGPSCSR